MYVSDTKDRGLLYQTGTTEQLVGYTNVDWAENDAIADPNPDLRSLLGTPRLRGVARSSRQLHCRAQRPSTEERLLQHAKPYG